jgi:hypothetical protein
VPGTRPPYRSEFGAEAVRLIRSSGKPLSQTSKDLGVAEQTYGSGSSRPTWMRATATTG